MVLDAALIVGRSLFRLLPSLLFAVLVFEATVRSANAAEPPAARTWEKYNKEIEVFHRSIELTPLSLSKQLIGAGDAVIVSCSFVNKGNAELIPPLPPAPPPGSDAPRDRIAQIAVERKICHLAWALRRKDDKASALALSNGSVMVASLRPGEKIVVSQIISADNLNLRSGEWDVTLTCIAPTGGKVLFSRTAVLRVANPQALSEGQMAQKRKREVELTSTASRQLLAGLRMGELTLSNQNVVKGAELSASCRLANPSAKDIVVPSELAERVFYEQWYLTKQTVGQGRREPYGGALLPLPGENSFAAGKFMDVSTKISTRELEPGTYEVVLEVKTCDEVLIGTRKQKFKVVK